MELIQYYIDDNKDRLDNIKYFDKKKSEHLNKDFYMEEYINGESFYIAMCDYIEKAEIEYLLEVLENIQDTYSDIEIIPEIFDEMLDEMDQNDEFYTHIDDYLGCYNLIDCAKIIEELEYLETEYGLYDANDPILAIKYLMYYSFKNCVYDNVYTYINNIKNGDI